jgi:uncharacterized protein (TIGR02145 family)/uncharacterized repeat protein (TIGR02543 family)
LPEPTRTGYTFNGWYTAEIGGNKITTGTAFSTDAIIFAQWTIVAYTITFNATGGTVSPTTAKTGEGWMLATEPTPTRTGYTFDGWYTAETGGNEVTTSTVFHGNTTVYARWVEGDIPTYTITFNANGGTVTPTNGTTNAHGTLSSLPTPTRNGYTFTGWFSALVNGEVVTEHTEFFTDFTIYAHWKINTFTITFDPNGGTVSPRTATTGDDGRLASEPTPTRAGYTFDGWYTTAATGGTEVTTSTVFTANTTVYARWVAGTVPTYTITFNANSGTVTPTGGITTAHGTLPSLPTPTRNGYTFSGWFTTATGGTEVSTGTIFTANGTIYAHWAAKTFTVTFSSQGGSAVAEQNVAPGGKATAPNPKPSRQGYEFGDWYQDVAYTKVWHFDTDAVTEDITLFAGWVLRITFDAGTGGRVNPASANTDPNGKLADLPEPTRDGYTFDGWATAATGGTPVTTNTVFRAHTTIYAHWAVGNINLYNITLDANGGKIIIPVDGGTPEDTIIRHTNAHGTLDNLVHYPELIRVGYAPDGWFSAKTGGTKVEMDEGTKTGTKFAADTRIYAHWTAKKYNVTFSSAGPAVAQQPDIGHHAKVDKPNPGTYNGWELEGWYRDAEYTTAWDFDKDVVESDITLYAKWKWVSTVTRSVTFLVNGGKWTDGTTKNIVRYTGEGFRLAKSDWPEPPIRENYSFRDWRTTAAGGGNLLAEDHIFAGNTTQYAQWTYTGAVYTITFEPNGGEVYPTSGTTTENIFTLASLPNAKRFGYEHLGWFTEVDGGTMVQNDYNGALSGQTVRGTKFDRNVTVYAHWRELVEPPGNSFYDSRDGRYYNYVKIGDLDWMAENLKYTDGTNNCVYRFWENCPTVGRSYNWTEAQTVCPAGWYLPSRREWENLRDNVGDSATAGAKLKATEGWGADAATDDFEFSALKPPTGNGFAYWWSTDDNGTLGYTWFVRPEVSDLRAGTFSKTSGYPVRCFRDAEE